MRYHTLHTRQALEYSQSVDLKITTGIIPIIIVYNGILVKTQETWPIPALGMRFWVPGLAKSLFRTLLRTCSYTLLKMETSKIEPLDCSCECSVEEVGGYAQDQQWFLVCSEGVH